MRLVRKAAGVAGAAVCLAAGMAGVASAAPQTTPPQEEVAAADVQPKCEQSQRPHETNKGRGAYGLRCDVEHTMGWGSWADLNFWCPDELPWVSAIEGNGPNGSTGGFIYGPYDDGPDDGGHFWLRLNAFPSGDFKFRYICSADG